MPDRLQEQKRSKSNASAKGSARDLLDRARRKPLPSSRLDTMNCSSPSCHGSRRSATNVYRRVVRKEILQRATTRVPRPKQSPVRSVFLDPHAIYVRESSTL